MRLSIAAPSALMRVHPLLGTPVGLVDLLWRHSITQRFLVADGLAASLLYGEINPHQCSDPVLLDAGTVVIHVTEIELRQRIALLSTQSVPLQSLSMVPFHTRPAFISAPKVVLAPGITVLGGKPEQSHRFRHVALDAPPLLVHSAETGLCVSISLTGSSPIPLHRICEVKLDPLTVLVHPA